jgi:uncharacterized protein YbjT (DUF2867 family)
MKVLVAGANGKIGKILVDLLQKSDRHIPRAMVRKEEQAQFFRQKGVDAVISDLEGTVDELAEAAKGCDAIALCLPLVPAGTQARTKRYLSIWTVR